MSLCNSLLAEDDANGVATLGSLRLKLHRMAGRKTVAIQSSLPLYCVYADLERAVWICSAMLHAHRRVTADRKWNKKSDRI
jgi:hypothetical protein